MNDEQQSGSRNIVRRLRHSIETVGKLYYSNRTACSRLIVMIKRDVARWRKQNGNIVDIQRFLLTVEGYALLIRQESGSELASRKLFDLSMNLAENGDWEKAVEFVFHSYMLHSAYPPVERIPEFCKWILRVATPALRPQYYRVACLLMCLYHILNRRAHNSLRYLVRANGDIPDVYRSRRNRYQRQALFQGFTDSPIAEQIFGKSMLSSVFKVSTEELLFEIMQRMNYAAQLNDIDKEIEFTQSIADQAFELGFVNVGVDALADIAGLYFVKKDWARHDEYLHRLLLGFPKACSIVERLNTLSITCFVLKSIPTEGTKALLEEAVLSLRKVKNLYPMAQLQLDVAEAILWPDKSQKLLRRYLSDVESSVDPGSKDHLSILGIVASEAGYVPRDLNGKPWILSLLAEMSRSVYQDKNSNDVLLSHVATSVLQEKVAAGTLRSPSIKRVESISNTRIQHDVKYHLSSIRSLLEESSGSSVTAKSRLAQAIRDLKQVFVPTDHGSTLVDVINEIKSHIETAQALYPARAVEVDLDDDGYHPEVEERLFLDVSSIAFNIIVNAFRHSPEESVVFIRIRTVQGTLSCTVRNDKRHGQPADDSKIIAGMSGADNATHGRGRQLIQEVAARAGVIIDIEETTVHYTVTMEMKP